jgi:hypothetical protein
VDKYDAYDLLYRLASAAYSETQLYTYTYVYGAMGNRTAMTKTITSTVAFPYLRIHRRQPFCPEPNRRVDKSERSDVYLRRQRQSFDKVFPEWGRRVAQAQGYTPFGVLLWQESSGASREMPARGGGALADDLEHYGTPVKSPITKDSIERPK